MQLFTDEYLVSRGIESDYLMHYGVPGMKWGHRKGTYSVGGLYNRARARGDARNEKRWNTELARDSAKAASRAKIAKQLDSKGHKKLASAFSKSSKIHKDWTKSDRIMADMYKKSKQSRLKKADAADKAKADKKAQKQAKLDSMTPEQKKAYIRKQRLKRAASRYNKKASKNQQYAKNSREWANVYDNLAKKYKSKADSASGFGKHVKRAYNNYEAKTATEWANDFRNYERDYNNKVKKYRQKARSVRR